MSSKWYLFMTYLVYFLKYILLSYSCLELLLNSITSRDFCNKIDSHIIKYYNRPNVRWRTISKITANANIILPNYLTQMSFIYKILLFFELLSIISL